MKEKFIKAAGYGLDRLKEPSTWQGIGFVVGMFGCKFGAGLDWGQAAGIGGTLSAMLKIFLPDSAPKEGSK